MSNAQRSHINNIITSALLFLLCSIPSIYTAVKTHPIIYPSDCTSAISVAASIAGYDWSEVVSHAGYYGYGYLFLFFPLYLLEMSPITIYKTIAVFGAILIGLTPVIAKKILAENSSMSNIQTFIISLVCGFASLCNIKNFSLWNEEPLLVCIWLFALYLFRLMRNNKSRKYELILAFLLGYVCTLHARAVILIPLFMVAYTLYWLLFKEDLVRKRFWIILSILFLIARFITKYYQHLNWSGHTRNTSVVSSVTNAANVLHLDATAIKGFFMIFSGIIYTQTAVTGGIILLSAITIMFFAFRFILKLGSMPYLVLDKEQQMHVVIVGLIFMIGWLGIIAGQGISWLPGVYNGLTSGNTDWVYGYKAFTYSRYSGPFVPVVIMCGMMLFFNLQKRRMVSYVFLLINSLLSIVWWKVHLIYMTSAEYFLFFIPAWVGSKNITKATWLAEIALISSIGLLFFIIMRSSKVKALYAFLLSAGIFMGIQKIVIYDKNIYEMELAEFNRGNAGYEFLSRIHDCVSEDTIYVVDTNQYRTDHQVWYIYQYLNYDLHISPTLPEDKNEFLLFFNDNPEWVGLDDFYYYQLDDNEYVACNGEEYIELLEAYDISLEKYGSP